ncbi:hypothetical protein T492DRAFT_844007 [Pavlovales sp. CCMP2436]|nr:hypothetical protein T492DRAFT_844007 [Pavlovales sp. CCMP2436]
MAMGVVWTFFLGLRLPRHLAMGAVSRHRLRRGPPAFYDRVRRGTSRRTIILIHVEFGEECPGGPAGSALVFSGRRVSETQLAVVCMRACYVPVTKLAGAQPSVRKPASRLNLLLDSEDPLAFSARVLAALERRRSVEAQLHYALLLNTLPVDSASSLAQPTLGSIHRRANLRLASVSEPREEMWTPVVDALWTEVRADWRRAHAAIDFEERDYAAPWRLEGAREPHFGRITSAHVRVFEPFALAAGVAGATRVTAESQSEYVF